jgi:DNA-binding MltR family transcriptional regulator
MNLDSAAIESFESFTDDLLAERTARPLVIVAASKVNDLLSEILGNFLLPKIAKAKEQDELLDGDAPLATFSAKIKLCRRLSLIDQTLYVALERLRTLRNFSAHSISFQYARSPVREHLSELRKHVAGRDSYRWTNERYFDSAILEPFQELQCLLLTLCVLLQAIRENVHRTAGSKDLLGISAR